MYFKKMSGERCYLSPIELDDAPKYAAWLNDPEVTEGLVMATAVISLSNEREILARLAKEHAYAVVDKASDELIGNVGLLNVNHLHRTAEIGIFIGDKRFWGKGYGREAMGLLIDYAYAKLNLNNLMLRVYAFNERAVRCYEALGFKKVGERRESLTVGRKAHNEIFMDLLPEDFYRARGA